MIKVKFIGEVDFMSQGLTYTNGGVYEVSDEVAKYLKDTFRNIEILEEVKTEAKPKVIPEVNTKVTPKK